MENNLWDAFQKLSQETRIPMSRLIDEAVEDLLIKHRFSVSKDNKSKNSR